MSLIVINILFFSELVNNKMNDMELNLIPLWELVIERNFLSRINYSILNEDDYFHNKHYDFMKSLLKFVPTVSPVYCNSLKYNFTVEFLIEALKYSMNSVAVENPKLYLEWSPQKIDNLENHDTINEVFISIIYYLLSIYLLYLLYLFRKCCTHLNNHYSLILLLVYY